MSVFLVENYCLPGRASIAIRTEMKKLTMSTVPIENGGKMKSLTMGLVRDVELRIWVVGFID